MKLKYAMLLLVVPLATLPLLFFWMSPYAPLLQRRLDENSQRYLLLARNLGAALERYHRDMQSVFAFVTDELRQGRGFEAMVLLDNLDIRHICLFDSETGELLAQASMKNRACPKVPPSERWLLLQSLAGEGGIQLSTVQPGLPDLAADDPASGDMIFMVEESDGMLGVAAITLGYIQQLGGQIAFGKRGHAAIVDKAGNVMSHPMPAWEKERRNLSALSIVQDMLEGRSGVTSFYSPAMNAEMIAGYAAVNDAGWGVMVPQPIEELRAEIKSIQKYVLSVSLAGFGAAVLIAFVISWIIARPLERLSKAADLVATGHWPRLEKPRMLPLEVQGMVIAFNKMVDRMHASVGRINGLAYFDAITGLANRAFFTRRASQYLEDEDIREQGGAIMFLDLNGFKGINDRLGHQAGDDLLAEVGHRINTSFGMTLTSEMIERDPLKTPPKSPPELLAARLGGDEFAMLLPFSKISNSPEHSARQFLLDLFELPFLIENQQVSLSGSVGIACYPRDGRRLSELLRKADLAMYDAKEAGGNEVVVFEDRRRTSSSMPIDRQKPLPSPEV